MIGFGLWELAMGGVVLYLERNTHPAIDSEGPSVSLFSAVSGTVAVILSVLILARKNIARKIAVYWLLFHATMFLIAPGTTDTENTRELAVKIGAAPLWLIPLLLAILLVNKQVTDQFTREPDKAA